MKEIKRASKKILLVLCLLGLALLYAASRIQVIEKGYEVSKLRAKIGEMERANGLLRSKVAAAKSTEKLARWTQRLQFSPPKPDQVLFVEGR